MGFLDSIVVGQFEDTSLGLVLLIGAMLLTALVALGLSVLLWFRNRSVRRRRKGQGAA